MLNEKKSAIGLCVTDACIRFVEVLSSEGKFVIAAQGEKTLEAGIIKSGRIQDEKSFSSALQEVFSRAGVNGLKNKSLAFCLNSDLVFYHAFNIMVFDKTVTEFMIKEEFLKNIPYNNEKLGFVYKIISADQNQEKETDKKATEKAIVAAYKKDLKAEWKIFLEAQDMNLSCFEFDAYAIFEAIVKDKDKSIIAIIDATDKITNVFFFVKNKMMYSYSSFYDLQNAESSEFLKELKRTVLYFENENSAKLQKIHVCGNVEKINALLSFLKGSGLGVEIEPARPSSDFKIDSSYIKPLGSALRCLIDTHNDGFFLLPEEFVSQECQISKKDEKKSLRLKCFLEKELYRTKNLIFTKNKLILRIGLSLAIVILAPFIIFLIFQNGKKPAAKIEPAMKAVNIVKEKAVATTTEKIIPVKKSVKVINMGSTLNIRSGAGKNFGVIGKAEAGKEYVLVEEAGGWVKIIFGDKEGWVMREYVELVNKN
jgi:hypothetical protein